jgi:hypothetical protein
MFGFFGRMGLTPPENRSHPGGSWPRAARTRRLPNQRLSMGSTESPPGAWASTAGESVAEPHQPTPHPDGSRPRAARDPWAAPSGRSEPRPSNPGGFLRAAVRGSHWDRFRAPRALGSGSGSPWVLRLNQWVLLTESPFQVFLDFEYVHPLLKFKYLCFFFWILKNKIGKFQPERCVEFYFMWQTFSDLFGCVPG